MLATVVALINRRGRRVPPLCGRRREVVLRKRVALLMAMMAVMVLVASGVAMAVTKIGGPGPNILRGTNGADSLLGKGGKDGLFGLRGADTLLGGTGNDLARGDRGSDSISGGRGNDLLIDGPTTEFSHDSLVGGGGNDVLDAFNKPAVRDTIVCGSGFDRVLADRKDVVASDCERVAVGLQAVQRLAGSIPGSFFEGLNPRALDILFGS
jgi:Ca2+-binding RTX toxin-like protein